MAYDVDEHFWDAWSGFDPFDAVLTDPEEFLEWYGPVNRLESWNEGIRREERFEGYISEVIGSAEEQLQHAFDTMKAYPMMPDERYAIGYVRMNSKQQKGIAYSSNVFDIATSRFLDGREQCEQEFALKRFCIENGFVKFDSFAEVQTSEVSSMSYSEEPFFWLKLILKLCAKNEAAFLYCELGSIFRHPEFFALVRKARKSGVKVIAVKSGRAVDGARRSAIKRKVFTKRGFGKVKAEREERKVLERYPVLRWKKEREIPTKLFNTYEHLFNGADPIYRYFLNETSKNSLEPNDWVLVRESDKNIADRLHDVGHLTVGGYGWNKQLARKARLMIFSDDFRSYCRKKFEIAQNWEMSIDAT